MECVPALLHNASAYGSSGMEDRIRKWNQAGSERNQEKSSSVVFVEYSGIWLFLSAANHGWMVAASWQITIVAGILLTPLFGKRIPLKNLCMAFVILAGIFLLQIPNFSSGAGKETGIALLLIIIGAFSYPLGNRKMMEHCPSVLNTFQRVFGKNCPSLMKLL